MVHRVEREPGRERERLRRRDADDEAADEARPRRDRDPVELVERDAARASARRRPRRTAARRGAATRSPARCRRTSRGTRPGWSRRWRARARRRGRPRSPCRRRTSRSPAAAPPMGLVAPRPRLRYGARVRLDPRYLAVAACGGSAFLDMYATQPLLPDLRAEFHTGEAAVGATISVLTFACALAAPFVGPLADAIGRKRVIVSAILGLALVTFAAARRDDAARAAGVALRARAVHAGGVRGDARVHRRGVSGGGRRARASARTSRATCSADFSGATSRRSSRAGGTGTSRSSCSAC